ncbi:unnamed protein product [Blepharisma stoltei]|uniref:Uncharacterized protein n=1 Tax=Blepharisma stoltei TaxID=1481888 RepID=A0AAU9JAS6_9CILI|nr:unnamed protein product [Blepharisma stoltei]
MRQGRTKKRSKSREKRSPSRSADREDSLLVNMLNERASKDRQVLISKDQWDVLKNFQTNYKEMKSRAIFAEGEINKLRVEVAKLESANEKLKEDINFISKQHQDSQNLIRELSKSEKDGNVIAEHQLALNKLKLSLEEIEGTISRQSATTKKYLLKTNKILAKHTKLLLEQQIAPPAKTILIKGIKQMSQCIENVLNSISGNSFEVLDVSQDLEIENHRLQQEKEEAINLYKDALEKMKEQTQLLRDRLKDLESGGGLKKVIEEQETKIASLTRENEILNQHIKSLQISLNEQYTLVEHLKDVIKSLGSPIKSEYNRRSVSPSLIFDENEIEKIIQSHQNKEEKNLQEEITSLDKEIQLLQVSLQKALLK